MTPACPKPTKNQSYAEPVQLSRPEYPSQSPTHHADTQISPITLKSSASKTPREKSGCKLLADCGGEPAPATGKGPPALAGKSTLNRIEHAWDTGDRRYHQISANLKKLSNLFVTLFLDAHQTPPARITLDIDAPDVERPMGARRTPSSTAITNTAVSCPSMSSAAAISCSPNSDPPTSMAPGVRATRSGASSR